MKETAMLDIALHQHGICGIPTIASKSTLTPTPTLTSRARSMEQAHPVRALEGPNISAIDTRRSTGGVLPGHGAFFAQNLPRIDGPYPNIAYRSGEETQAYPQTAVGVEPVVWNEESSYGGFPILGSAYEPFQAGNFGGTSRGQCLTPYSATKAPASSWLYPAIDSIARSKMSVARSDIDTELSSPSPESLLSELSDRDEPYEVQHHYSSPGTSWSGSGATTNTALDGVSSNARVGLTGFPYASSGQEIPFLNSSPGHGVYPMHQQPSSSSAWSNSTWPYMDNLDARGPSQWGSAQETAYISPLDYDDMSEQQGVATHGSETAPTLHTPPQENPIVRTNYAGQVGIQYNNDLVQDHAPPTANTQRTKEDQILLEGKRAGLTYKEIKRQMNSKVAESTLRGRYRSLTKERKDRVRKPVWTTNDVRLLKEAVHAELNKHNGAWHRQPAKGQRMAKVSWKQIGEYIVERGGSYHFGNSTCKKKWAEISAGC